VALVSGRLIARIGKPHGIRGEVTVQVHTDDPAGRFVPGTAYATEAPAGSGVPRVLTIARARKHREIWLLGFAEVPDRTGAEGLRGTRLLLPDPPAGAGPSPSVHNPPIGRLLTPAAQLQVDAAVNGGPSSVHNPPIGRLVTPDAQPQGHQTTREDEERAEGAERDAEEGYYEEELVGLRVDTPAGEEIGTVTALLLGTAQDLLEVRLTDGRVGLVPFVEAIVPVVDIAGQRVVVDAPPGLFDLAD